MKTYKITYKTPDNRIESDYFQADDSSEARFQFEWYNAKCKILSIKKI